MDGPIDAFVSGFGTGGTLAGCGKAIKHRWPNGADHRDGAGGTRACSRAKCPCCHFIEGVADGFVPPLLQGRAD